MQAQRITMIEIYTDYTNDLLLEDLPEELEKTAIKKQALENLIIQSKESNYDILKHFNKKKSNFSDNLHELTLLIKKEERKIWNQIQN